ncbi:ATP-binding cassette domain-containing protein [Streptomyces sp. ND05-3B]|nr:ATP-binding cassette domain-containing protein [Streptomyces caniscabiei]MBE4759387.1 ATP-binding cassette domain-containing protein [Streptomyces caniscabiei]MBE4774479.1 ATP-binding cassette domain-containing protein [Streptomyces caniscabiei]MBE4788847.1 ATP-binding cassette domain-containing protein [Streptomyces caniscabiei]MBE4798030.1 ATP-binding cassette domain-containing protein [Streptomyces caniscabiei]
MLLTVVRRGGAWGAFLAATSLLLAGIYVALPALMGRTVDAVLGSGDITLWLTLSVVAVALLIACDALDDYAGAVANARSTAWLRHSLFGHVLDMGPRATRRHTPGDLTARLVGNTSQAGSAPSGLVWAVTELIPPIGAVVALALIDPWLCLTFLTGLPLIVLMVHAFARDVSDVNDRYFATQGRIATRLADAVTGIRTITAAGTTAREAERVLAPLPELHRHGRGTWHALSRVSTRDAVVVPLLEIAVLAVAGLELARGRITPGQLLAATEYVVLATGVSSLVASVGRLALARATAGRVAEILDAPPMTYGRARLPVAGGGRLEFRGVTVRAPEGTSVLDGVDLEIPEGTLTAVVGRSGSGKSLLAALAGRLTDPDDGEVRLDGVPLHELTRTDLRRAVAYGFERPALLGETFTEAIMFGPAEERGPVAVPEQEQEQVAEPEPEGMAEPEQVAEPEPEGMAEPEQVAEPEPERMPESQSEGMAEPEGMPGPEGMADEAVREAAAIARADTFLRTMPDGYDTALATAPLSGGETQRVGLARAFAQSGRGGRLLILDDVTASLDTVTEHHITQVLTGSGPLAGRTRLVVTHRASTAARADLVIWLDAGRVRRRATHRALWRDPGYRAVFRSDVPETPNPSQPQPKPQPPSRRPGGAR